MRIHFAITVLCAAASIATAALAPSPQAGVNLSPVVIRTNLPTGMTDVDASLTTVSVTFDRLMGSGMSWTGGPPLMPTIPAGAKAMWLDRRTCELPVHLEAGHYYRIGINSTDYRNFRSSGGIPATPSAITFCTKGASAETLRRMTPPQVVSCDPPESTSDVDSATAAVRIVFDRPMGSGFSFVEIGPSFPDLHGNPTWNSDHTACTLPVSLLPGESYQIGLNGPMDQNLMSVDGVSVRPVVYHFKTRK